MGDAKGTETATLGDALRTDAYPRALTEHGDEAAVRLQPAGALVVYHDGERVLTDAGHPVVRLQPAGTYVRKTA